MATPIIYLSKSRAGNFDDIIKVKNYLNNYDCIVTEFTGGIYSDEKLWKADHLVILPPILEKYEYVGRGQYEEFIKITEDRSKEYYPFIITSFDDKNVPFGTFSNKIEIINNNWTTDYGKFFNIDTDDIESLADYFELKLKKELIKKENKISYNEVFNTLNLL